MVVGSVHTARHVHDEKDPCPLKLSRIGYGSLSLPPRKSFKTLEIVMRSIVELSAFSRGALECVRTTRSRGKSSLMEAMFRASYVTDVEMFGSIETFCGGPK